MLVQPVFRLPHVSVRQNIAVKAKFCVYRIEEKKDKTWQERENR
jgi:hypothetical protein